MGEQPIEPPPVVAPPIGPQNSGPIGVTLDQDGRLDEDVVCRSCGYNLRGLMLDSNCPECDSAIEYTLHRFLLRFSDPAWLRRLRSGLTLLIVAILIGIVLAVAWIAVIISWPSMIDPSPIVAGAMVLIPTAGLTILSIVGYVLVTAPEPGSTSNGAGLSARRLARIGLISSAVIGLIEVISDPETYAPLVVLFVEVEWFSGLTWILGTLGASIGFVGLFALFIYGRRLASRLPADRLAKSTSIVMWGYMLPTIGYGILGLAVDAYINSSYSSTSWGTIDVAIMVLQFVFGIPVLVFGIWGIVLLFMYRYRLKQALALAAP